MRGTPGSEESRGPIRGTPGSEENRGPTRSTPGSEENTARRGPQQGVSSLCGIVQSCEANSAPSCVLRQSEGYLLDVYDQFCERAQLLPGLRIQMTSEPRMLRVAESGKQSNGCCRKAMSVGCSDRHSGLLRSIICSIIGSTQSEDRGEQIVTLSRSAAAGLPVRH